MYPDDVGHLHQHSHLLKIPIAVDVKVPIVAPMKTKSLAKVTR